MNSSQSSFCLYLKPALPFKVSLLSFSRWRMESGIPHARSSTIVQVLLLAQLPIQFVLYTHSITITMADLMSVWMTVEYTRVYGEESGNDTIRLQLCSQSNSSPVVLQFSDIWLVIGVLLFVVFFVCVFGFFNLNTLRYNLLKEEANTVACIGSILPF